MDAVALSILFFTILIIIKISRKYILEHSNKKRNEEEIIKQLIKENYKKILLLFLIFIIISRIYKLGVLPAYIGCDEAGCAYDSYCLANWGVDRYLNKLPVYLINFGGGQSALYAYTSALLIKIFGANILSYRLPALLFFIVSIVVSYILIDKFKDKRTALLFTFLIIICPWHIEASREGLDCNLLAPMFMIDLLLLSITQENRKTYMYIISGISIGITLYTYALAYLLIPVFLVVYIAYMLYLKRINFKQIVILGIPIFILAVPLIWVILLNKGIVNKTSFGIFTIPKLFEYRGSEIKLSNIYKYGLKSITNIFFSKEGGLYLLEIPFFLIGCFVSIKETIKSIKTKTFDITTLIFISLVFLLLTNLTVKIGTLNRANIIFMPIIYIITIGISHFTKGSINLKMINAIFLTILFINYETMYYMQVPDYSKEIFRDNEISVITKEIEKDNQNEDAEKYILTYNKAEPYIYTLIANKISPYDFYYNADINIKSRKSKIESYGKYHFLANKETINKIKKNEKNIKYILVVNKVYEEVISDLLNYGFSQEDANSYYIMKNY